MYSRQKLTDLSPMAIKQINDNFSGIFLKLSGNIDTLDIRNGAVTGNKVAEHTLTGSHLIDGTLTVDNFEGDFVVGLDLLKNPTFVSLAGTVDGNKTLIQQNDSAIKLQANRIDGLNDSFSDLVVDVDGINARVVRLDDGEYIVSQINMQPDRIKIDANNVDLTGVTTLYDKSGDSRVEFGSNKLGDVLFKQLTNTWFQIYNEIGAVSLHNTQGKFLSSGHGHTTIYGNQLVTGDLTIEGRLIADLGNLNVKAVFG